MWTQRQAVCPSVRYPLQETGFFLKFSLNLLSKFRNKICVPSASLVKIGALTPLLPSQPRFQVSRKPPAIATNALNVTEYRIYRKSIKPNPLLHLKTYIKFCPYLTYFSSDCSWTSVTEGAHKNLGAISNFVKVAQLKPPLTQWPQPILPALSMLLSYSGGNWYNRSAHDAVERGSVSGKSAWARPFFSCVRKYSYVYGCAVKLRDILKVKNALLQSIYCFAECSSCRLHSPWS
jgi:hypothetical protein